MCSIWKIEISWRRDLRFSIFFSYWFVFFEFTFLRKMFFFFFFFGFVSFPSKEEKWTETRSSELSLKKNGKERKGNWNLRERKNKNKNKKSFSLFLSLQCLCCCCCCLCASVLWFRTASPRLVSRSNCIISFLSLSLSLSLSTSIFSLSRPCHVRVGSTSGISPRVPSRFTLPAWEDFLLLFFFIFGKSYS